jgi:hypothetical protein
MRVCVAAVAALFVTGWSASFAGAQGSGATTATATVTQAHATVTVVSVGAPMARPLNVVVVGKVVEFEPEAVEALPFRGAPREQAVKYKVANLKIEDAIHGTGGITRIRVGFPADDPTGGATTAPAGPGWMFAAGPPAAGTEALFNLAKHPNADFYVVVGPSLSKKDPGFTREVDRLRKYARTIADPVAGLKANDLDDRFEAAQLLLQRYLIPQGRAAREPIPDEENKALIAVLTELPWLPADGRRTRPDGRTVPHRAALWFSVNPAEYGFKRPEAPKRAAGDPPVDYDKLMEEATTKFLKEMGDKIKLKRFVQK